MATVVNLPTKKNDIGSALGQGLGAGIPRGAQKAVQARDQEELSTWADKVTTAGDAAKARAIPRPALFKDVNDIAKAEEFINSVYPNTEDKTSLIDAFTSNKNNPSQQDVTKVVVPNRVLSSPTLRQQWEQDTGLSLTKKATPTADSTATVEMYNQTPKGIESTKFIVSKDVMASPESKARFEKVTGFSFTKPAEGSSGENSDKVTVYKDDGTTTEYRIPRDTLADPALRKEWESMTGYSLTKPGEEPKSDLFDATGSLKTEASAEVRRTLSTFLSEVDPRTGLSSRPNPTLMAESMTQMEPLLRQGMSITAAGPIALGIAMKKYPNLDPLPLSPELTNELRDRTFQYEEGVAQIDKQLFGVADAIGIASSGKALLNYITGQAAVLGATIPFPETETARSKLRTLERGLIVALVESKRLPVAEQDVARNLIPSPDDWFTAPEQAALKLRSLREYLSSRRTFIGQRLGAAIPDLPSTADLISNMSNVELQSVNVQTLNESEKAALDKRLRDLGY